MFDLDVELAEGGVWGRLQMLNQPTEYISITGTVENLLDLYSFIDIVRGRYSNDNLLESIVWLD